MSKNIVFCHEKIKFISSSRRVMFFLYYYKNILLFLYFYTIYYRHADDGVFDDFPKISEEISKLFRRQDELSRTISENF